MLTQTGQRSRDFRGSLQFVVNLQQDDKKVVMTLPGDADKNSKAYQVNFRFYQRIEGTFHVGPDAVVKSLQVRLFEEGGREPKLTQTASVL